MNRRIARLGWALGFLGVTLGATLLIALAGAGRPAPDVGHAYLVPYRLTNTNHFLVRVRINGKGPFNFLVDTGAPALYVATETAKKIGLKPDDASFWTEVDRLEFEGGAVLEDVKARVEDPFQLVGMNALGLPGASIDGILGFTILAKYKLELDPTKDRMVWTRLDYDPKEPPAPRRAGGQAPELQAMNALGPLAKFAAALVGKQPEDELIPRGFLGVELDTKANAQPGIRVARVVPDSPAAAAGLREGDRIVRVGKHSVDDLPALRSAVAELKPGGKITVTVRRGVERGLIPLTITAGEGF